MPRGSAPGERRGGRKPGTPNKSTAEIKAIASKYTPRALEVLAHLMENAQSEQARVAAANALLDRGHGKPHQTMDVKLDTFSAILDKANEIERGAEQAAKPSGSDTTVH